VNKSVGVARKVGALNHSRDNDIWLIIFIKDSAEALKRNWLGERGREEAGGELLLPVTIALVSWLFVFLSPGYTRANPFSIAGTTLNFTFNIDSFLAAPLRRIFSAQTTRFFLYLLTHTHTQSNQFTQPASHSCPNLPLALFALSLCAQAESERGAWVRPWRRRKKISFGQELFSTSIKPRERPVVRFIMNLRFAW
jgi:hypothetical protein